MIRAQQSSAKYSFRHARGFHFSRRAIGFLDGEFGIDAGKVFDELEGNAKRELRKHMDFWLQGGVKDTWFHGFPNQSGYKLCFTFKWHKRRQEHRLYGFLFNPKPKSDRGFRLCVLIYYTPKNEMGTDYSILDRVNQLRNNLAVNMAIGIEYPECLGGNTKWTN